MTTVNVHEAKTHLSRLLDRVEHGESITIARAGRPIVDLVPHTRPTIVFGGVPRTTDLDDAFTPEADAAVADLFADHQ